MDKIHAPVLIRPRGRHRSTALQANALAALDLHAKLQSARPAHVHFKALLHPGCQLAPLGSLQSFFRTTSCRILENDLNGSRPWSSTAAHYDAQGRNDATTVNWDNGGRTEYIHDAGGTQEWAAVETNYNAQGTKTTATETLDNGDRIVRTYRPDVHPNAYVDDYFYANGEQANEEIRFDGYDARHVKLDGSPYGGAPTPNWVGTEIDYTPPSGNICGTIVTPFGTFVDCS